MNTKQQVQLYAVVFTFIEGQTEQSYVLHREFRGSKIYTSVTEPNMGFVEGIYFGDNPDNQIIGKLSAWEFSITNIRQQQNEFMKKHGLEGKSGEETQKYLDDNELTFPDVPSFLFPTLEKGTKIRITGRFKVACNVSLTGVGVSVQH